MRTRKRARRYRPYRKSTKRKGGSREHRIFKTVRDYVLPNEIYCYQGYWSWLPGQTGEPLQLDIFFPNLDVAGGEPLAIEVQGDQHRGVYRKAVKVFFPNKEEFKRQQANDELKKERLGELKIPLIEIWPEDPIDPASLRIMISEALGVDLSG
jgi:hypothetical protein